MMGYKFKRGILGRGQNGHGGLFDWLNGLHLVMGFSFTGLDFFLFER